MINLIFSIPKLWKGEGDSFHAEEKLLCPTCVRSWHGIGRLWIWAFNQNKYCICVLVCFSHCKGTSMKQLHSFTIIDIPSSAETDLIQAKLGRWKTFLKINVTLGVIKCVRFWIMNWPLDNLSLWALWNMFAYTTNNL